MENLCTVMRQMVNRRLRCTEVYVLFETKHQQLFTNSINVGVFLPQLESTPSDVDDVVHHDKTYKVSPLEMLKGRLSTSVRCPRMLYIKMGQNLEQYQYVTTWDKTGMQLTPPKKNIPSNCC